MESISSECAELKHNYDSCFNKWFAEKFLKNSYGEDSECEALFEKYQTCVKVRNVI